jgi:hypothetical protein
MKTTGRVLGVLVLVAALTALATGAVKDSGLPQEKYDAAVENLLIGLASDNLGLRESAAFMLGELKADAAVIPLMQMLRSDDHESSRIVAALALCRIGEGRGVYAVKRAASFDESDAVAQRCAWFYDQYVHPGSFDFIPTGTEASVVKEFAKR